MSHVIPLFVFSFTCLLSHSVIFIFNHAQGVGDLGELAVSLSSVWGRLETTLTRVRESTSVAFSDTTRSLPEALRLNMAATQGRDRCFEFLRRCGEFGQMAAASATLDEAYPAFSHVRASNDLKERLARLGRKENVVVEGSSVQGPCAFQSMTFH
jgi:hypothetical protein